MRMKNLSAKTSHELVQLVVELKQELLAMRFQNKTGNLESTAKMRETRRTVARALTILNTRKELTKDQQNKATIAQVNKLQQKEMAEGAEKVAKPTKAKKAKAKKDVTKKIVYRNKKAKAKTAEVKVAKPRKAKKAKTTKAKKGVKHGK